MLDKLFWKIASLKTSCSEKWKGYSERELFCITTILEPIVKIYEECFWVHSYSVELHRSSHRRCFKKKGVLKHFGKLTKKHLCQILFFNKVESDFVTDFKNIFQANYKNTRITFLKLSFVVDLEHIFVCWVFSEATTQRNLEK